jgi:hypothetical protein
MCLCWFWIVFAPTNFIEARWKAERLAVRSNFWWPEAARSRNKQGLRLPDSASTHLIDCVSDLSSVWVVNSLCCVSSSSLGLCACVCCGLNLVCVAFPPLLLCFLWSKLCKGERLQLVEIPRKWEKISKGKDCGIQVDHWITWKGLRATLVHRDATTWK